MFVCFQSSEEPTESKSEREVFGAVRGSPSLPYMQISRWLPTSPSVGSLMPQEKYTPQKAKHPISNRILHNHLQFVIQTWALGFLRGDVSKLYGSNQWNWSADITEEVHPFGSSVAFLSRGVTLRWLRQMLGGGSDCGRTTLQARPLVLPSYLQMVYGSVSSVNLKVMSLKVLVQEECPPLNDNKNVLGFKMFKLIRYWR